MRLRDLCDVAYVLRREQAERLVMASGGGDLEALWAALDEALEADAPAGSGSDRARSLQAMLSDLGVS